ncbi:MobF family relaxase [Nocardioides okcheonensis]|uniref:MobF family relaxase n=1 Tax=Nocardioides okcheonensis TaxID=2894081 RepID=UPI001E3807BE|nr:MobF family relaxase [Nocardioides okcheonensis]UFN45180.1 relaxase domain-containing protein [Nocardioides okcheonensis]
MSLHKLTAGSGYDYLTRQVAALDATDKGHVGLASYYAEKGETPGVWIGSGMAGIDGLDVGDLVTAEQMQNLFGAGHHPLATERTRALDHQIGRPDTASPTEVDYRAAARLGAPFKVYDHDVSAFRIEVAKRLAAVSSASGHPSDYPVPAAVRAAVRTEVARELFRAEHGRDPSPGADGARELAAVIARHSRPKTTAVAGYDLTFSPVKSVSTLWAIADPHTAATIERAHQAAVQDALTFLETTALYTREGTNGVRQVDVRGLVATAFTHRDSRAGDPDLHTHVAVVNKVETLSPTTADGSATAGGKWLAIDGRPLHKVVVSASETYNTALERHLADALGIRFAERYEDPGQGAARGRPVREIVGVDARLNTRFSKRRLSVEERRAVLATDFQATHGRPPTPVEAIHLAQQATLETRKAKHEPRSLAEQRAAWRREAVEVLGSPHRIATMVRTALNPTRETLAKAGATTDAAVDSGWFAERVERILATLESHRSTWQYWHVYAEAQRQVRSAALATKDVARVVDLLVGEVLDIHSISLARTPGASLTDADGISEPRQLRRADGSSVYSSARADLHTSRRILAAEQRLVAAAGRHDGHVVDSSAVDLAVLEQTAHGITLNLGQSTMVREMATSGARLQLAIAPAGSGKTTAMRALASAWTDAGGTILGLAPSAAAADALRSSIAPTSPSTAADTDTHGSVHTDTLAKLTHSLGQSTGSSGGHSVAPIDQSPALNRPNSPMAEVPAWIANIGPHTLVVIDEAGMADTLSLDAAVTHVLERGGSVRLIGDDQQLAAIGAGGVLRDIRTHHGALHLSELLRFTNPAEAAASLALREGRTEALGFYLDHHRVHVGDLASVSDDVFTAWHSDRALGLDSIMLAPTRELVSELNYRARTARLDEPDHRDSAEEATGAREGTRSRSIRLGDGNEASVGDLIITRQNDRRLRTSTTDWVKNGDRWTVLHVHENGDLSAQHLRHHHTVRLPHDYVANATGLGYACTIHTAQGVTADTMHGLATGEESRQQLYTMLTRGSAANHIYLQVVGDGDPHSIIHPSLTHPRTPTEILESILARDEAPHSATSLLREQTDPTLRLGLATQRYLDALHYAAEAVLRQQPAGFPPSDPAREAPVDPPTDAVLNVVHALDHAAQRLAPGLSDEPAWATLRARLLLLGADGHDPTALLTRAVAAGDLRTATDRAAVLDWRLDSALTGRDDIGPAPDATRPDTTLPDTALPGTGPPGPLPWMPGIPTLVAKDPQWGGYLTQRAELVASLADQVRTRATNHAENHARPHWAQNGLAASVEAIAAVEVWRAAMRVPPDDRRPVGPPQQQKSAADYQRRLARAVTGATAPALQEWRGLLVSLAPQISEDEFTPILAERLAAMSRAGLPAHRLVRSAATAGVLPDAHAAAALWWRMSRHVTPAGASRICEAIQPGNSDPINAGWMPQLTELFDADLVERLHASIWWPALVSALDHGVHRGWQIEALLGGTPQPTRPEGGSSLDTSEGIDECLALIWRTSIALEPIPDPAARDEQPDAPPADLWEGVEVDPSSTCEVNPEPELIRDPDLAEPHHHTTQLDSNEHQDATIGSPPTHAAPDSDDQCFVEPDLTVAALIRDLGATPLPLTEAEIRDMNRRAQQWDDSPVSRERAVEINAMARDFFETAFIGSWARAHLVERLGIDLAGHEQFHPGHAPAGWRHLVEHLRRHGVTDDEMLCVGVATTSSRGDLIDRFRDRLIFPIADRDEVLGFVGRRHPDLADETKNAGPKYLNTADTPLFHKGAQLFGSSDELVTAGAQVVLVEGPLDALEVTIASAGRYLGVAPLGTALTDEQTRQLAAIKQATGHDPIIATDADPAGRAAAERDFWMLAPHGLDPAYARLPSGLDPADLMTQEGPAALTAVLLSARPLGEHLLCERLLNLAPNHAHEAALRVLAARHHRAWRTGAEVIATHLGLEHRHVRRELRDAVKAWDLDPHKIAHAELARGASARADSHTSPAERWAPVALTVDSRLVSQPDWPATADALQLLHDQGRDVDTAIRTAIGQIPLGSMPARDLRYRLASIDGQPGDDHLPAQDQDTSPSSGTLQARNLAQPNRPAASPSPSP